MFGRYLKDSMVILVNSARLRLFLPLVWFIWYLCSAISAEWEIRKEI